MRVESIRTLDGPNTFHAKPVLSMYLRLEDLTGVDTDEVPGFSDRLLTVLPGLAAHHCSRGHAGGFIERLHEGTYFGHVTEHVALEMAGLLGSNVTYGKTRYAGEEGFYQVVVRYQSEAAMRSLLYSAVELVEAVRAGNGFPLAEHLAMAGRAAEQHDLGPSTKSIVTAAARRSIPWRRLNDYNLVQLGHGRHRRLIEAAVTDRTSHIALEMASDKALTKRLLHDAGIPVPHGEVVTTLDGAVEALEQLGTPVVVKPLNGNQGRGITMGVTNDSELVAAYQRATAVAPEVIVEQQLEGDDYRVLVVGGRVVAASRREPCNVIGNGSSTISELIDEANLDPLRGEGHEKPLTRIVVDDEMRQQLRRCHLDLASVPPAGEKVMLRGCANISTGATAEDATDCLGPGVRALCEQAAAVMGLDICGIDLVASTISDRPDGRFDGGVLEVNAGPGLRMHLHPSSGMPRDVGEDIVAMLYPPGTPSRVPLCAVTGTNGKTTVTRMIGHVLRHAGLAVGITSTDGINIGGRNVSRGDHTGPASAKAVLADPTVEAAVLETARGGILRRGLGYDWSDVAVITNITRDHIGQDGIETLDELLGIKALVAERVRDGGILILNADDPGSASLAGREGVVRSRADSPARLELVLFGLDTQNPVLQRHVTLGGRAYYLEDGWLLESHRGQERRIVEAATIPVTFDGSADFQIANSLAAAAASRAMGRTLSEVAGGLVSFSGPADNPGRATLFGLGKGYVMVDYGHNPEAFRAMGALSARWPGPLIGIVGVPGDRDDAVIEEAAVAAARSFPRLLLREDADLRGRAADEVAGIMAGAARAANPDVEIELVGNGLLALESLLPVVADGAMVVIYYEHLEPLSELLTRAGGRQIDGSGPFVHEDGRDDYVPAAAAVVRTVETGIEL